MRNRGKWRSRSSRHRPE